MKGRAFIQILRDNDFALVRQRGSHRTYKGVVKGKVQMVQVAVSREGDDIRPGTLASMIRQSGLPKKMFK